MQEFCSGPYVDMFVTSLDEILSVVESLDLRRIAGYDAAGFSGDSFIGEALDQIHRAISGLTIVIYWLCYSKYFHLISSD